MCAFPGLWRPRTPYFQRGDAALLGTKSAGEQRFRLRLVLVRYVSAPHGWEPGALFLGEPSENGASMSAASLCSSLAALHGLVLVRGDREPCYDGYRHALIASWACFAARPSVRLQLAVLH